MSAYFIDTEFIENGSTIDLISIAVVRDDGKSYYAISNEFNASNACDWVKKNVLTQLPYIVKGDACFVNKDADRWRSRKQIASDIKQFIGRDKHPEFWADFSSYDWVAFCQLFGRMIDLPKGWPMYCRDIQQYKGSIDVSNIVSIHPHHALYDAFECRARHVYITQALKTMDKTA